MRGPFMITAPRSSRTPCQTSHAPPISASAAWRHPNGWLMGTVPLYPSIECQPLISRHAGRVASACQCQGRRATRTLVLQGLPSDFPWGGPCEPKPESSRNSTVHPGRSLSSRSRTALPHTSAQPTRRLVSRHARHRVAHRSTSSRRTSVKSVLSLGARVRIEWRRGGCRSVDIRAVRPALVAAGGGGGIVRIDAFGATHPRLRPAPHGVGGARPAIASRTGEQVRVPRYADRGSDDEPTVGFGVLNADAGKVGEYLRERGARAGTSGSASRSHARR